MQKMKRNTVCCKDTSRQAVVKRKICDAIRPIMSLKHFGVGDHGCDFMQASCCSPWPAFMVALPFCHFELRASRRKPAKYPKQINSLGDHIRTRRLNLRLLQRQVADQIGVHEQTITGWERNATLPEVHYMPAIIQFLGYNPQPPADSIPERLAAARRALGLSQRKLAGKLGVDPATLMGWEARQHQPTGKSLDLIGRVLSSMER